MRTIPDCLEAIFTAFRENLPKHSSHQGSLYDAWKLTLEGSKVRDSDMYGRIGEVAEMLEQMQLQVKASSSMTPARKIQAEEVIKAFQPAVSLPNLHMHGMQFLGVCTIANCGLLGLVGDALRSEFSVNVFSPEEVTELADALLAIREQVKAADFLYMQKIAILSQIDLLIWRLKHPEFDTLSQAADALGKLTLTANRLERLAPSQEGRDEALKLREELASRYTKAIEIMDRGSKVVAAVEVAYDFVQKLRGQ